VREVLGVLRFPHPAAEKTEQWAVKASHELLGKIRLGVD
jgi:hypothetical protein